VQIDFPRTFRGSIPTGSEFEWIVTALLGFLLSPRQVTVRKAHVDGVFYEGGRGGYSAVSCHLAEKV
jgi:hypothetical protein